MATKAELNNQTELPSASAIPIAQHRTYNQRQNDNAYGDPSTEKRLSGLTLDVTNTEPVDTSHWYDLKMTKQGRFVHVSGSIINRTGGTVSNEEWFTVLNDFVPEDGGQNVFGVLSSTGALLRMQFLNDKFKVISSLSNLQQIDIIPTLYRTKD